MSRHCPPLFWCKRGRTVTYGLAGGLDGKLWAVMHSGHAGVKQQGASPGVRLSQLPPYWASAVVVSTASVMSVVLNMMVVIEC